MRNWEEEYKDKIVSAEDAANMVKSGDFVYMTTREPRSVGYALAARKEELKGVKIRTASAAYDFGWYDPGWEDSFEITVGALSATDHEMVAQRRADCAVTTMIPYQESSDPAEIDVLLLELSPPDEHGFCNFGNSLWNKKRLIKKAKLVIAEINEKVIRPCGEGFLHISEIDYLVKHASGGGMPGLGTLAGKTPKEPEAYVKSICKNVSQLIRDGDTIQIGIGRTTEALVKLGVFSGKQDLGYHSEATIPGIISLVRQGVFNGKCKTLNPGKATVASIGGGSAEELAFADNNPLFQVVDVEYLEDIRTIAAHDSMVAINNALMIDLFGQVSAATMGIVRLDGVETEAPIHGGSGGQIPFVFGAIMSRGGRSIHVMPATAKGGTISRIVPVLPSGSVVTIQRGIVDYVVTEYGVARLWGKTLRQRAQELINVAHPSFRDTLKRQARELFWT